jgi:hypothetical protein
VASGEPLPTLLTLPTSDRWVQRLCLRFAGQSPKDINRLGGLGAIHSPVPPPCLRGSVGVFVFTSIIGPACLTEQHCP